MSQPLSIKSLPVDLIIGLVDYFSVKDILHLSQTCSYYYKLLCQVDPRAIWKPFYHRDISEYVFSTEDSFLQSKLGMSLLPLMSPEQASHWTLNREHLSYYRLYQLIFTQYRIICQLSQLESNDDVDMIIEYLTIRGHEKLLMPRLTYNNATWICHMASRFQHLHIIKLMPVFVNDAIQIASEIAAENGWIEMLKRLIELNPQEPLVFTRPIDIVTILASAARGGHLEMINWLIEWKQLIPGPQNFDLSLAYASENGHIDIINRMLELGATDFNGAFGAAVNGGHRDIAERMITLGANFYNDAAAIVCENNNLEMIEWMISLGANDFLRMLRCGVIRGHLRIVDYVLQHELPNLDFAQLLEYAVIGGNIEVVDRIVALDVARNPAESRLTVDPQRLNEPLRHAAWAGHRAIIKRLIELGANNINVAIETARRRGRLNIVRYIESLIA